MFRGLLDSGYELVVVMLAAIDPAKKDTEHVYMLLVALQDSFRSVYTQHIQLRPKCLWMCLLVGVVMHVSANASLLPPIQWPTGHAGGTPLC